MRYLALCCDYDGTLATRGRVLPETILALERLIASGRRLVLVTGRELDDLQSVCPRLDLFEYVVAENGALLYQPATRAETPLATPAPEAFIATLRRRGVTPISVGRVIVATWEPHETAVLEAIRDLGLELQVIFNKGAVMVLPAGVNKATGLAAALEKMGLSAHNAVGVGDAENDHALLGLCECSAAVANALPTLKEVADIVTAADHGAGVVELIEEILRDDLASREPRLTRHHILLGTDDNDEEVRISPYGENLLLVGTSGSGKSMLATGLLERLAEHDYTYCVINLVGLPLADRPAFFTELLPRLVELRARTGRPHWLVIDEAHHLLPATRTPGELALPESLRSVLQITVHPDLVAPQVLAAVDLLIAIGETPQSMIEEFCRAIGMALPPMEPVKLKPGEALAWPPHAPNTRPFRLRIAPSHTEREHRR